LPSQTLRAPVARNAEAFPPSPVDDYRNGFEKSTDVCCSFVVQAKWHLFLVAAKTLSRDFGYSLLATVVFRASPYSYANPTSTHRRNYDGFSCFAPRHPVMTPQRLFL
jgi:hypothetical protein